MRPQRSQWRQQRPWCLPCRGNDGSRAWAMHLGVACDWHWHLLSASDQEALRAAVSAHHPRGGRVSAVNEQIWIVRVDLRGGGNTVERTWLDEWARFQRETAE
jgi:hypothetical protein